MAEVLTHESHDVDDRAKALSGWEQAYEQLSCGKFRGSAWQLVMSEGVLLRESTNRQLREQFMPPADHLVFAMPLSVEHGAMFAGRPLERESFMVLTGGQEYEVITAGEFDLVALSVHRNMLSTLQPAEVDWLRQAEQRRNLILAPDAASAIRYTMLNVCADAERKLAKLQDREHEAKLLEVALSQAVAVAMSSDQDEPANQSIPRRADTRLRVVKRAIEFMRANLYNDIGVPEICAAAFASRRSLQYCFEEFMHTTPQAYLRALRLNEARRTLKQDGSQPITVIANMLGFSSASHFTQHYKLMFEELPSETVRHYGPGVGSAY